MNLLEPFHYDFLQRAFFAGLLLAVIAPFIGSFLVIRGYALFADALAHVSLLGIALSLFLGIPTLVGAILVSIVAAFGMERLRSTGRIMNESAVALFLSGSLALAIVLISLTKGTGINLISYLFGSLATVTLADFWLLLLLSILALGFFLFFFRELFLISLDEDLAKVSGMPVTFVNYAFILLAALMAAVSLEIVGVLLVGALMVIPTLSALQFHVGFRATIALAVLISVVSFVSGFFLSFAFALPAGGAIVLSAIACFLVSLLANSVYRRMA
jgi:zinc transport system permease protein